jgi:single-stranded DNA-binding protein
MIDALVTGKVHSAPVVRQTRHGRDFVKITVRVPLADSDSIFAHVVAFEEAPCKALRALTVGDAVSVAGRLTPGVWTDKEGAARPSLDVVADQVLTVYAIRKRRDTTQAQPEANGGQGRRGDGLRALETMHGPAQNQPVASGTAELFDDPPWD